MDTRRPWLRAEETPLRTPLGTFRLRAYEFPDAREHSALLMGDPSDADSPLVRVQSSCLTGTAFGAVLCDCRDQLAESLRRVAEAGCGCVLYLAHEGRGHGLVEKVRQLSLIAAGVATTADAAGEGQRADLRTYDEAFFMLSELLDRRRPVRLMTNNPSKIKAFGEAGYRVRRVPLEAPTTDDNREYLQVKKHVMGHLLTQV